MKSINGGYSVVGSGGPDIGHYEEADSQTYTDGMPVILSSKKVAIAVASGSDLDTDGAALLGLVLRDGRNGTSPGQVSGKPTVRDVPVMHANSQLLLRLPFWHTSGVTSAEYQDFEPGDSCVLRNVGGIFVANIGNTTKPILKLIRKEPAIPDAEGYYWGLWKCINSVF